MIKRHLSPLFSACLGLSLIASTALQAEPLKRVVSAGANITEIIIALDAEQQIVAVDSTSQLPSNLSLPVVGYHRQLSAEGLLALAPDAVIGSDEMGPDSSLNQLQQAGVQIHRLNSQSTVASLEQRIDALAKLLGHPAKATELHQKLKQQLTQLDEYSQSAKPMNTLFFMSHDAKKLLTAGSDTTANSIMELAGAVNLAKPHLNSYKPLSDEAILSMQPELLLLSQRSLDKLGGVQGVLSSFPVLEHRCPVGTLK